ncbi:hypothetical protein [Motilibacter deserti]|uniref:Uncharacterized protein n=1 Tax=Motilibacter deserti TaxID=2714956 RepID=A0ABX0GW66_9ACTN|nr:hypothetical protein [Motilibacter deserti]NHC15037.1 hypothetical protein [Motilibacter deserti]
MSAAGLRLHARWRGLPVAACLILAVAAGAGALLHLTRYSGSVHPVSLLLLAVTLAAAAAGTTLAGPCAEVERSMPRLGAGERALHVVLVTAGVAVPLLLAAQTYGASVDGLSVVVLRAALAATGLLALGAVLFGERAAWVMPTLCLVPPVFTGAADRGWARYASWPLQDTTWLPAAAVALVLALVPGAVYAWRGARR